MKLTQITITSTQVSLADGTEVLFSYQTPVAALVPGRGWMRTDKFYSITTSRHINKWLEVNASSHAEVAEVDQWEIDKLVAF
ncbi:MAG: hypothetical protein EB075_05065 [Bacteroidetes bacterium]|nr:hypothetical protein [Bacteroidota bacterium]